MVVRYEVFEWYPACPECGAPLSADMKEWYCAEFCGWHAPKETHEPRMVTAATLRPGYDEACEFGDEPGQVAFGEQVRVSGQ